MEVLTKWDFKMIVFLDIKDFVAAISHILHNLGTKKNKVNLSVKMQKPFIPIDNVKKNL